MLNSAAEIRPSIAGPWADAHKPGGMLRNDLAIQKIELDILAAVERDPEGSAKSWLGRIHLMQFGFLLGKYELVEKAMGCKPFSQPVSYDYPYAFELKDVMLESKWIIAQLVAEEYFEDGPESTPFTPEAVINSDDEIVPRDIFATNWRPDVNLDMNGEDAINLSGRSPDSKPAFAELDL